MEEIELHLEWLIDMYSLGRVLIALANVTADRAEWMAHHDVALAEQWLGVSVKLESIQAPKGH
jgi:hypothetical protein